MVLPGMACKQVYLDFQRGLTAPLEKAVAYADF